MKKSNNKPPKPLTPEEEFKIIVQTDNSCRELVSKATAEFFVKIRKNRDFSVAVQQRYLKAMPPWWLEFFIARFKRLEKVAHEKGFNCSFGKWTLSKDYAWTFVKRER